MPGSGFFFMGVTDMPLSTKKKPSPVFANAGDGFFLLSAKHRIAYKYLSF